MGKQKIFIIVGLVVLSLIVGVVIGKMRATSVEGDGTAQQSASQPHANQPSFTQDSTAEIQRILKERPNDAKAFAEVGTIYFDQRKFTEAIEYYKKAVALDPNDVNSYNDLGLAYHYTNRSDEGLKYIEEGIKKNPTYQRIWLSKGFILAIRGNIAEARSAWEKVYSLDPNSDVGRSAASFLEQYKGTAR